MIPHPRNPVRRVPLSRVRVPSNFYDGGEHKHYVADFKLGLGPCGKVVEKLLLEYREIGLFIYQYCTDGEKKVFFYPWTQITGRIEETYFHD